MNFMAFVGQATPFGACNLLEVPNLTTLDAEDDDGDIVVSGIRPKSSPLPRRKISDTDEELESESPLDGSRRVSFADASGLSLVQVKEFDTWDIPKLPEYETPEGESIEAQGYVLTPLNFTRPLSTLDLYTNVREQKIELEALELLQGTTILRGVIRVLNMAYTKAVYVRTTVDSWSTHFDLLAEYIQGSNDGVTDAFSFKLTLVPPFREGAQVGFCLRYETPVGTFWSNNDQNNYMVLCQIRKKDEKKTPSKQRLTKKSCLKSTSQSFPPVEPKEDSSQDHISTDSNVLARKICNGQSGTSEEHQEKLPMENRQNTSRRSRRKAARMAQVKDYFTPKGVSGCERDDLPSEIKGVREKYPKENHSDVQSMPKRNKSVGLQFLSEPAERSGKLLQDDSSRAHDFTSISQSLKSESLTSALPEGERASELQDKLVRTDDNAHAEKPNTNAVVSKSEECRRDKSTCDTQTKSKAGVSSGSPGHPTGVFTFETVMAPLYQQVYGKVGSKSQDVADSGSHVWSRFGNGNPHHEGVEKNERKTEDPSDPTDGTSKKEVSSPKSLNSPQSRLIQEDNSSVAASNVVDCAEPLDALEEKQLVCTFQDPQLPPGDLLELPQTGTVMSNADLLESQAPPESLDLQGEVVKEQETQDPESQISSERRDLPVPERTHAEIKTNSDRNQEGKIRLPSSDSIQPCKTASQDVIDEAEQQNYGNDDIQSELKTDICMKEDQLFDVTHELNSNDTEAVDAEEAETLVPCTGVDEPGLASLDAPLETEREMVDAQDDNGETYCRRGDDAQPSDEVMMEGEVHVVATETLIHRATKVISEGLEGQESEHGPTTDVGMGLQSTEFTSVKKWEASVEEEEYGILVEEGLTEFIQSKEDVKEQEACEDIAEEIPQNITSLGVKEKEEVKSEGNLKVVDTTGKNETTSVETQLDNQQIPKNDMELEKTEVEKCVEPEGTESEDRKPHAGFVKVFSEGTNLHEQEEDGNDAIIDDEGEACLTWEDQIVQEEETGVEESLYRKDDTVDVEGDHSTNTDPYIMPGEGDSGERSGEESLEELKYATEADCLLVAVNNEPEDEDWRGTNRSGNRDGQNQTEVHLQDEEEEKGGGGDEKEMEEFQNGTNVMHDWSTAEGDSGDVHILTDEPENDQASSASTSAESDSDDEVELYMHCLRVVHTGAQKDRSSDAGFTVSKRPSSGGRRSLLSARLPSIIEPLDEEQQPGNLQENHEDVTTAAAPSVTASSGQGSVNRDISCWKDTFSCSKISKTLLYTILLVVFLVVAYHYDFFACFGLYLISVVWLFCHGERQPAKNNNRSG